MARHNGRIIHEAMLSADDTNALAAKLLQVDGIGYINIETADGHFVSKPIDLSNPQWKGYESTIVADFSQGTLGKTPKIAAEMPKPEAVRDIIVQFPHVAAMGYTGEHWVTFANKNATKWQAIMAVAAHLQIGTENIAAFGDDMNDVEMLEKCGIGVAMDNGVDQAKAVANFVCASNDDDGIAQWIEENLSWT